MNQILYKGKWSFPIDREFVLDPSISLGAKMVYIALKSFCSPNGMTAFPSSVKLSKSLGIARGTFYRYCDELENNGWVSRKQNKSDTGKFTNTIYTVYPPCFKKETVSKKPATVKLNTNL